MHSIKWPVELSKLLSWYAINKEVCMMAHTVDEFAFEIVQTLSKMSELFPLQCGNLGKLYSHIREY